MCDATRYMWRRHWLFKSFGLYQENDIPEEITEATKSIQFVVKTTGLELLIVYKVEFLWAKA